MSVTTQPHSAGFLLHTLTSSDGEVVVSSFGGQILSWKKEGVPIVFENRERAIMDGVSAYRGGAPICFPYFSKGALLPHGTILNPQHGRARTTVWNSKIDESKNSVVLTTVQPTAEGYGPTDLWCELTYSLSEELRIRATIRNVGEVDVPVEFVVHTYWSTSNPAAALVCGLGNRYLDNLLGLTEQHEDDSSACHHPPFDRVYLDAGSEQNLTTEQYHLKILTKGCSGAVLWNPGKDHALTDLGAPDFICVESGVITPSKTLKPEEEHTVEISFDAKILT